MLRPFLWVHDKLTDLGFQLGKLCLGIILFSYTYEVVARYFFNAPTWWADEAVSYSLSIGCFLIMPYVTRDKGHVAVTFLLDMMSPAKAKPAYWVIYLLGFIVCAAGFWINLDENIRQIVRDVHLMKVKPIPKYYISVFITFGFGMSALHFLRMLDYRRLKVGGSGQGGYE